MPDYNGDRKRDLNFDNYPCIVLREPKTPTLSPTFLLSTRRHVRPRVNRRTPQRVALSELQRKSPQTRDDLAVQAVWNSPVDGSLCPEQSVHSVSVVRYSPLQASGGRGMAFTCARFNSTLYGPPELPIAAGVVLGQGLLIGSQESG